MAVGHPSLVHKGQTHVCHIPADTPCPGAECVMQTELLNRAWLGELLKQPPLYKLTLASFHIWHCNDFTEPLHTFLLRVCHQETLTEFFLTGDSKNHVQIWARTRKRQAQGDSAQENCCPQVKLLEKGAKTELTFTEERQKNNGVTFKIKATGWIPLCESNYLVNKASTHFLQASALAFSSFLKQFWGSAAKQKGTHSKASAVKI